MITLFHEFGHALHGLFSAVRWPSQSGTDVPRDFVEYPSQVNEIWAWEPSIVRAFALHHETGEPMPSAWVDTLLAARQDGEGFATTEYLAAALLDQAWYRLSPDEVPTDVGEVEAFEAAALEKAGVAFAPVPPRYRTTLLQPHLRRRLLGRATTRTSGPRCWTRTRSSGSGRTAACAARTATRSGRSCSRAAGPWTRWSCSGTCAVATR